MRLTKRRLEPLLPLPNSATMAERMAAKANIMDWQFRRPILNGLPDRLAVPVAKRYVTIHENKSRRDANLYMLDIQDELTSCALSLSASDDEIVNYAKSAAHECLYQRMRFNGDSKSALKFLVTYIAQRYKINLPLPYQYQIQKIENHVTLYGNSNGYRNVTKSLPVTVTVTEKKSLRNVTLSIEGLLNRLCDELWWRRILRNVTIRNVEKHSINLGLVHRNAGIYISDESMQRRTQQKRRNKLALEKCTLVNEEEQEYNLQDLIDHSLANPSNRRAELMVRIRGTEEVSKSLGHSAVMLTITTPSSMHARNTKTGGPNPKYDGTTPLEAQKYLTKLWAQIRAKLARNNLMYYGFRVAEPHHDGTPHWHILLFMPPENIKPISNIVRDYALRLNPDEPGADKYRFNQVIVDPKKGSATGYIAKYISKGIDGYGVDNDLYGKNAKDSAQRISAWASVWGIRQFQQLGGPPVTLYRELRRVQGNELTGLLLEAWQAADSGNWEKFIKLMGGPSASRKECPLKIAKLWNDEPNKYLEPKGYNIIGVEYQSVIVLTRTHQWTVKRQPDSMLTVSAYRYSGPPLPPLHWNEIGFEKIRA